MELMIPLDSHSGMPYYEQIYEYIREEIKKGNLKSPTRLPSTRLLAEHLKVSRSTTQMAYEQLLSEGYIESVPCKGYFVSRIEELVDTGQEIRGYLHSARGVNCTAEQIVVGAGTEYLLMLLSRILGPDHTIAMENPTYKQAYRVFESLGYPVVPVEMDGSGLETSLLEGSGADIAYVMPSHQYPTGIVMPVKRRQELLSWAYKKEGRYLIEDDYDSEFRYKGKPIPALQGMDGRERVIYSGTFSKSIAPAIRVSYLVLPKPLLAVYKERVNFYTSTVSRIDQNILYQFMVSGCYERHLNRMRAVYKAKHDALIGALKPFEHQFAVKGEYAGLHLLLTDKKNRTEKWLVESAKRAGVKVYGLSSYLIREGKAVVAPTVILGYAMLSEDAIKEGIRLLRAAWSSDGEQEE